MRIAPSVTKIEDKKLSNDPGNGNEWRTHANLAKTRDKPT